MLTCHSSLMFSPENAVNSLMTSPLCQNRIRLPFATVSLATTSNDVSADSLQEKLTQSPPRRRAFRIEPLGQLAGSAGRTKTL